MPIFIQTFCKVKSAVLTKTLISSFFLFLSFVSLSSSILEATLFPLPNNYDEDLLKEAIKNQDVIAFGMGLEVNKLNKKNLDYLLKNYEGK